MNIVTRIHYNKNDTKFSKDYTSIEVLIDGTVVAEYGDEYHDRGMERADSFIDGYVLGVQEFLTEEIELSVDEVADYE